MASWFDKEQEKKGLGSLLPGKGGERIKTLPPGFKQFLPQPDRLRPPITEPGGPRPPRPPGISLAALKRRRQQLREQLRQIEAQIRSLGSGRPIRDPWDFGPEPPRPDIPWGNPPPKIGPGTPPPSMPAPTPVGPPTMPPTPWKPDPPWGG
jgi:hypothetical protein